MVSHFYTLVVCWIPILGFLGSFAVSTLHGWHCLLMQTDIHINLRKEVSNIAAEKNFENKVKAFLEEKGFWFLKYWGGAAYTKRGSPDLLEGMYGSILGLEVKAPRGEPSELQLYNLEKIRKAGGRGILLYPKDFDNFKEFVADTEKGNSWYLDNIEFQDQWKEKLRKRG